MKNVVNWFKFQYYVLKGAVGDNPALVQIMAWRQTGDKPLFEPTMAYPTDTYITPLQWVDATLFFGGGVLKHHLSWLNNISSTMFKIIFLTWVFSLLADDEDIRSHG